MYPTENVRDQVVAIDNTAPNLFSTAHRRQEIVITNTSPAAQKITLSFGIPAITGSGVVLLPYAVYFASNTAGFNVYQGDIFAISDAAGGKISVFER